MGRHVADSTFAEDEDSPRPRTSRVRSKRKGEESTDGLTDLERKVQAMKIWGGIEKERKEWLINEIKKKEGAIIASESDERRERAVRLKRIGRESLVSVRG